MLSKIMTSLLQVVPYELDVARQRLQVVEDQLSKTHYLLGEEFTAVDIMCGQILTLAEASHACHCIPHKRNMLISATLTFSILC